MCVCVCIRFSQHHGYFHGGIRLNKVFTAAWLPSGGKTKLKQVFGAEGQPLFFFLLTVVPQSIMTFREGQ